MVFGEYQADSDSTLKRGQRGVLLINLHRQRPGVISHRRRFFPAVMFFFISLVSFRHLIAGRADENARKLRQFAHILIGDVVKGHRAKDFLLESDVGRVIEGDYISLLRLGKRARTLFSRNKFYLQSDSRLHTGVLYYLSCWHCKRGLRSAK